MKNQSDKSKLVELVKCCRSCKLYRPRGLQAEHEKIYIIAIIKANTAMK